MPDNRIVRRAIQRYWRLTRAVTLGAQGIVLDGARRVLLVRHGYRSGWHFPGGGVEKNEVIEAALARELREETGVELTGPAELLGVYANFAHFPNDHVMVFAVRSWQRPHIPAPNREIVAQDFFRLDALPDDTVGPARRRLAELIEGAPRDPVW